MSLYLDSDNVLMLDNVVTFSSDSARQLTFEENIKESNGRGICQSPIAMEGGIKVNEMELMIDMDLLEASYLFQMRS